MRRLVMALFVVSLQAQRFEVASIKPNKTAERNGTWSVGGGGRFAGSNIPLKFLITTAYQIKDSQVSGLPRWSDGEKYDIEARGEGSPTQDQMIAMLKDLLTERFMLRFHWITKQQTVYALRPAKSGVKLRPSAEGSCVVRGSDEPSVPSGEKGRSYCRDYFAHRSQLDGTRISTRQLVVALGSQLEYPLIDKTGLKGVYDVHLTWNPDESVPDNSAGPSIFTALQEQLGLKLESTKGPVRVMVIDHVERPSEN